MLEKMILQTNLGKLTIEKNESEEFGGVFIKLNDTPILLLEENVIDNEYKIIKKEYHNKNIITDNDYINYKLYDIDINEVEILKQEFDLEVSLDEKRSC